MTKELNDFISIRDTLLVEGYKSNNDMQKYENIMERLIALEIIKKKRVNIDWLLETENVEEYNESLYNDLTQDEYNLLKEVFI